MVCVDIVIVASVKKPEASQPQICMFALRGA